MLGSRHDGREPLSGMADLSVMADLESTRVETPVVRMCVCVCVGGVCGANVSERLRG